MIHYSPIVPIPIMIVICVILLLLKRRGVFNFIRQIIIVMLLFVINMRFMLPAEETKVLRSDIDILFVVDNTMSMLAKDYDGKNKRLDGVKADVASIVEQFPDSRYAIVSFDNKAKYLVPYTYEGNLINDTISVLNGQSVDSAYGTSINIVHDTLENVLKRKGAYDDEDDKRIQIVFFITDGEITNEEELASFEDLSEYINGGAVLGYGTKEGGEMRVRINADYYYDEVLAYYDDDYKKVPYLSKLDEDNLEQLSEDLEIDYYHMEKPGDVDSIIEGIQKDIDKGKIVASDEVEESYDEIYWIFAAAIAFFLLIDLVYYRIKFGKER